MRNVSHARKSHQNTAVQEDDDDYEMDMDAQQAALYQHVDPAGAGDQAVRDQFVSDAHLRKVSVT